MGDYPDPLWRAHRPHDGIRRGSPFAIRGLRHDKSEDEARGHSAFGPRSRPLIHACLEVNSARGSSAAEDLGGGGLLLPWWARWPSPEGAGRKCSWTRSIEESGPWPPGRSGCPDLQERMMLAAREEAWPGYWTLRHVGRGDHPRGGPRNATSTLTWQGCRCSMWTWTS